MIPAGTTSSGEVALKDILHSGKEALRRGDIDFALRELERAVSVFPGTGIAHAALGSTLMAVKKFKEAVPVLIKAAALMPDDVSVNRQLGVAFYNIGNYEESAKAIDRALQINPFDTGDLFNLAEVCSRQGRFNEALESIEKILVLTSDNDSALRAYALLNQKLNNSDRLRSAVRRIETINRPGAVPPLQPSPVLVMINVEITTYCNLRCTGCFSTVMNKKGKWQKRHMGHETFKQILKTLPPAGWLGVYGIGEPTLHPDLPEMIRFAQAAGKFNAISITTNAMARTPDYYSKLFEAGLSNLIISVDSLNHNLIDHLRPGTDVNILKESIKILAQAFPGKIDICTVIGRKNIGSASELLEDLNTLGKLNVSMQPYDNMGNPDGCLSYEERAWFVHYIQENAKKYEKLKVNTASHFIRSGNICNKPWDGPYVTVEGYVTPCCRINDPNIMNFGSITAADFNSVWLSPETEQWRRDFLRQSPSACDGCPMFISRKAPSEWKNEKRQGG